MNRKLLICLIAGVACNITSLTAQDNRVQREIEQTKEIIAQYVKVRQDIAKEKNEWKTYKILTEDRLNLFRNEIKSLREQIREAEEETSSAERKIAEEKDEIQRLRAATNVVSQALPDIEDKLRSLYLRFPEPLQERLERLVKELGKSKQPANRMAVVVGILNEVDKWNSDFNLAKDEKTLPNNEIVLVDVVYLGLAIAYYSNENGTVGGIGLPAEEGWEWTDRPDLAPKIHLAVQYYNGDIKPAELVQLPVEIR